MSHLMFRWRWEFPGVNHHLFMFLIKVQLCFSEIRCFNKNRAIQEEIDTKGIKTYKINIINQHLITFKAM